MFETIEIVRRNIQFFLGEGFTAQEFKETPRGRLNVCGGVVRFGKWHVKQILMQFSQGRQFVTAAATSGQLQKVCGIFGTSVEDFVAQRRFDAHPEVFATHDVDVKPNVLPDDEFGFG